MPPSVNPLRLQVIDRIVVVLQAIVAGADYFFTPGKVAKRLMHIEEISNYPTYMVTAGEKGGSIDIGGAPDEYDETYSVSIKGVVYDPDDTVTKAEQALRDIRKAINEDSKSGVAGSLGVLTDEARVVEGPDMDDGIMSLEGFGYFDQKIQIRIHGDYGVL